MATDMMTEGNRVTLRPPKAGHVFDCDPNEASRFLYLLDAKALVFSFSWYREKGTDTPLHKKLAELDATYRSAPLNDELAGLLGILNGHQRAIYVCMNVLGAKNGSESRTDDNVAKVRAIFADFDDGLPEKPFPLKPTCLVHTSNDLTTGAPRYQAFWRVRGVSLEEFGAIEARLVTDWGADPNSVNLSRIQRLPGYWHQKHGVPHLVCIVEENDVTYSRGQIVKAFPPMFDRAPTPSGKRAASPSPSARAQRTIRKPARTTTGRAAYEGKIDIGSLHSALAHLANTPHPNSKHSETYADDYDTWVCFGLAIKRGLGDGGFGIWDEWARTSSRYPGAADSRAKWDCSFDTDARSSDGAVTVGTIFHCAKRHGWSFTRHTVASRLAQALKNFGKHRGQK